MIKCKWEKDVMCFYITPLMIKIEDLRKENQRLKGIKENREIVNKLMHEELRLIRENEQLRKELGIEGEK